MVRAKDPEHVVARVAHFCLFHQAGQCADEVSGLLLIEQQVRHVAERYFVAVVVYRHRVDQSKSLARVELRRAPDGACHIG